MTCSRVDNRAQHASQAFQNFTTAVKSAALLIVTGLVLPVPDTAYLRQLDDLRCPQNPIPRLSLPNSLGSIWNHSSEKPAPILSFQLKTFKIHLCLFDKNWKGDRLTWVRTGVKRFFSCEITNVPFGITTRTSQPYKCLLNFNFRKSSCAIKRSKVGQ